MEVEIGVEAGVDVVVVVNGWEWELDLDLDLRYGGGLLLSACVTCLCLNPSCSEAHCLMSDSCMCYRYRGVHKCRGSDDKFKPRSRATFTPSPDST